MADKASKSPDYIVATGSIEDTPRGAWVNPTDVGRAHWDWDYLLRNGAVRVPDANEREAHAAAPPAPVASPLIADVPGAAPPIQPTSGAAR